MKKEHAKIDSNIYLQQNITGLTIAEIYEIDAHSYSDFAAETFGYNSYKDDINIFDNNKPIKTFKNREIK